MEGKSWRTPDELIEMIHWLSGAPRKRWVKDHAGDEFTFGIADNGTIGMVNADMVFFSWQNFAPYTFLRDESEPSELVKRAREVCERTPANPDEWIVVTGDSIHRTNPESRQVVNTNKSWIVGPDERSHIKARAKLLDIVEQLQLVPQLADALEAAIEAMKVVCIDPHEGRELCRELLEKLTSEAA